MRDCPERRAAKEGPSFGSRRVLAIVSARLPITRQRLARVKVCRCRSKTSFCPYPAPAKPELSRTLAVRRIAPGTMQIHGMTQGRGEQPMIIARAREDMAQTRIKRREIAFKSGIHGLIGNEARRVADNGFDMIEANFTRAMRKEHELFEFPRVESRSWPSWVARYALATGAIVRPDSDTSASINCAMSLAESG